MADNYIIKGNSSRWCLLYMVTGSLMDGSKEEKKKNTITKNELIS